MNSYLSIREFQIAELLAWGESKKEISRKLFISERTVENTVRNIYVKLNITKATELSAWYFMSVINTIMDANPIQK